MRENPEPVLGEEQNADKWHIRSSELGYHLYFKHDRIADLFGSYYNLRHIATALNEYMPKGMP